MAGLAVETTKRILFDKVPLLRERYWEKSAQPPKWMDRLQAGAGPHKSGNDPHIAGRALDIILFSHISNEVETANKIVGLFLTLKEQMRWSAVIYNKKQWDSRGETDRLRSGDPSYEHVTHIHIEWRTENVNKTGFETELEKGLHKIIYGFYYYLYFGGGNPTEIRNQYDACAEKIKAKGGKITDSVGLADFVVKIGKELPRLTGDPLETDLEKARMWKVPIIELNELDNKL